MKLKELRKQNKFSQEDVSKFLNVARTTYIGYEQETSEPTIDTLCKLADYYKVPLDYLVGRDFSSEFIYLSDYEKSIIASIRQLNETNKIRLLGEIQGMLVVQE